MSKRQRSEILEAHRSRGRLLVAGGVKSFVLDEGDGEPVVLVHGVPASSFLYRKLVPELAARGLRGIAFDLPGMGFAERPENFDYSWSGLGRFASAAVDELGLERFHLVVHDIGGPIGFEVGIAHPQRIRSLTVLNSLVEVHGFTKPWVMRPFGVRGIGEAWLATMTPTTIVPLMHLIGVKDRKASSREELAAYVDLLKREDGGRAFLKVMRGFETTAEKQRMYVDWVTRAGFPIEVVWGADDPALGVDTKGAVFRRLLPDAPFTELPGKHFLQEEQPSAIADRIAAAVSRAGPG
ncbi:MAG: alpha/beta fold hydrolase [Deltaproteobacteria bacterium]|nr:alpha/beta fold hydrolase [Deltaproteobacteria bacterium]